MFDCHKLLLHPENLTSAEFYSDPRARICHHQETLKDSSLIAIYSQIIKESVKDKIVLQVNCGLGLLSLLAAKFGARLVIAQDNSSCIYYAEEIAKVNQLDHIIKFVHGDISKVNLPKNINQVDVILWQFSASFYQIKQQLPNVICARDRWLAPNGIIIPNKISLHLFGIEDENFYASRLQNLLNVCGFDMSPLAIELQHSPHEISLSSSSITTTSQIIREIDLFQIQLTDLSFSSSFSLGIARSCYIAAIVAYFTMTFTKKNGDKIIFDYHDPLSAAHSQNDSHWRQRQTAFYFNNNRATIPMYKSNRLVGTMQVNLDGSAKEDVHFTVKSNVYGRLSSAEQVDKFTMKFIALNNF